MTTEKKPTKAQKELLHNQFVMTFNKVNNSAYYHNRRINFFKKWNLFLKFINAIVGVGGLMLIGIYPNSTASFWVAGVAVILLFLNVLFDFSKKEETHRWLMSSYSNFDKLIAIKNTKHWQNLSEASYKKYKKIILEVEERLGNLKTEEVYKLDFLYFLSATLRQQGSGDDMPMASYIKWWQFLLADYFSMPNTLMKVARKYKVEQQQKQHEHLQRMQQHMQQQQEKGQQQQQKSNKPKAS